MSDTDKQPQNKKRGQGKSADKQQKELDALIEDAEFLDKEVAEAALHDRPKFGISDAEPELELGRRLEEARRELKLTQGELAERTKLADSEGVGISRAMLSMYESGKSMPPPRQLRILCEVLRMSPSRLVYGDDDPFGNFLERGRFGGFSQSDPEFCALLNYAFHNLHHHHKMDIINLMMGLLRGWDKRWFTASPNVSRKINSASSAPYLKARLKKPAKTGMKLSASPSANPPPPQFRPRSKP